LLYKIKRGWFNDNLGSFLFPLKRVPIITRSSCRNARKGIPSEAFPLITRLGKIPPELGGREGERKSPKNFIIQSESYQIIEIQAVT
jgi:hypothetical protein